MVWLSGEPSQRMPGLKPAFCCESSRLDSSSECAHSSPMHSNEPGRHELRIPNVGVTWRIIDDDSIVIAEVLLKKLQATPARVMRITVTGFDGMNAIVRGGG